MSPRSAETVLAVRIGDRFYAIPIEAIEEVLPALPVEPVPQCPSFVRGVVFVRGRLIPVLSAAERLGLDEHAGCDDSTIVCLRADGRVVGVEVDEAIDLVGVEGDELLVANDLSAGAGFFAGVIDHEGEILRLLDPEKLISETEAAALQTVRGSAQCD